MRLVVHHSKFYDWEPVPRDVTVTKQDETSGKVKPDGSGWWLMKVTRNVPTHTTVQIPEHQIVAKIVHEKTRPEGGRVLTRKQAVEFYLREHVLPHHTAPVWMTKVEVHDDRHEVSEETFRAALAPHAEAVNPRTGLPNIPVEEHDEHVAAYLEATDAKGHEDHLHAAFRVGKAVKS